MMLTLVFCLFEGLLRKGQTVTCPVSYAIHMTRAPIVMSSVFNFRRGLATSAGCSRERSKFLLRQPLPPDDCGSENFFFSCCQLQNVRKRRRKKKALCELRFVAINALMIWDISSRTLCTHCHCSLSHDKHLPTWAIALTRAWKCQNKGDSILADSNRQWTIDCSYYFRCCCEMFNCMMQGVIVWSAQTRYRGCKKY